MGRHILAQYDEESIVVYQAYNPQIAEFAVQNKKWANLAFNSSHKC
jgi:hypothetical protein